MAFSKSPSNLQPPKSPVFHKAFRFLLRTKPADAHKLNRYLGMARWIWNAALAEQQARHARGEKYANYPTMCKWLTAWREAPATAWLADGPSGVQQQVLNRLHEAYVDFFEYCRAVKAGGYRGPKVGPPKYKKFGREPGLRFPSPEQIKLDWANSRIFFPKCGWIRMRVSREMVGELRNATVVREGDRYFVSLQTEIANTVAKLNTSPTWAGDGGVKHLLAGSDGRLVPSLKALEKGLKRLRYLAKEVSRKVKGSNNRKAAEIALARQHRKIARQRLDYNHKLTTALANAHPVMVLEALRLRIMMASASGTVDKPGRGVRRKFKLNRDLADVALGQIAELFKYKCNWRGGRVIFVNAAYSSTTCRLCHYCDKANRATRDLFKCGKCRHTEHADIHAAKYLLATGHVVWVAEQCAPAANVCGESLRRETIRVASASLKQTPHRSNGPAASPAP